MLICFHFRSASSTGAQQKKIDMFSYNAANSHSIIIREPFAYRKVAAKIISKFALTILQWLSHPSWGNQLLLPRTAKDFLDKFYTVAEKVITKETYVTEVKSSKMFGGKFLTFRSWTDKFKNKLELTVFIHIFSYASLHIWPCPRLDFGSTNILTFNFFVQADMPKPDLFY